MQNARITIPLLFALLATTYARASQATLNGYSSSECVTNYYNYNCCLDSNGQPTHNCDLPSACDNVHGFNNLIQYSSFGLVNNYENAGVWDSDSVESDLVSGGHDYQYTDKTGTAIEYYSMHGVCGNYPHNVGTCSNDLQCQTYYGSTCYNGVCNLTWRCDSNSHTCSGYKPGNTGFDRYMVTCGSFDSFNRGPSITSQMRFGENTSWAGLGLNGDVNFLVLDTSCPFAAPFYIEMNSQVFKGLHLELGFTTAPTGDTGDSAVRGQYFAGRLNGGQPVAPAWLDTSRYDDSGADAGCPGECTVAMSCDTQQANSDYRVTYETLTNTGDPPAAPGYCSWVLWCC